MKKILNLITIGLFGTCDQSTWRKKFVQYFTDNGITFFNPQLPKDTWTSAFIPIEAEHLAEDEIIVIPALSESLGIITVGEIAVAVARAVMPGSNKRVVILIDDEVDQEVFDANPALGKLSNNMRKMIKEHVTKIDSSNVRLVNTLDELFEVTLKFYQIAVIEQSLKAPAQVTSPEVASTEVAS